MTDAYNKAKQLASLAGVTLGKPTYISENTYVATAWIRPAVVVCGAAGTIT